MCGLYALLATLQRYGANALVAFGKAAMHEGYRQLMLPFRGFEADLPQPPVDFFHRRIEALVDRLVVGFAADIGAIEFLAVKQCNYRVFELHLRHFSRKRHIADGQFVFAVDRENVFDAEPASRP